MEETIDSFQLCAKIEIVDSTSVTIGWNHIENAEVYKVEQHSKKFGWQKVDWTSTSPSKIEQLEENFGYRFRVAALQFSEENQRYIAICVSNEVVGCTQPSPPSTIALYRAIRKNQQFLVKRLIRRRPNLIEIPASNGYTPLANAIAIGDMIIVDVLLSAGASVHIGNPINLRTPLHMAFFYGHLPVARMLINKKANINAKDCMEMTPCHYAIDAGHYDILKFGLENEADKEIRDSSGWTLLMRAITMCASVSILKLLLLSGADFNATDVSSINILKLAELHDNFDAVSYIQNFLKTKNINL